MTLPKLKKGSIDDKVVFPVFGEIEKNNLTIKIVKKYGLDIVERKIVLEIVDSCESTSIANLLITSIMGSSEVEKSYSERLNDWYNSLKNFGMISTGITSDMAVKIVNGIKQNPDYLRKYA